MHYVGVSLVYKPHGLFAGNIKKCATFLRTVFNRCESEMDMAPSQAYFLQKRRGVGPLCHLMLSWICVDTIIPCPGVINKEGADTVGVHSSQTITFQMVITTSHFSNGIKERSHVFIPLEFRHRRDTRPMWRTVFFSYLDGVWEWVQVTSDHIANYYTLLAHAYATAKESSLVHAQVSSKAPPTVFSGSYSTFSLTITQRRSHNPSKGFHQECKGPLQIFRPSRQMKNLGGVPSIKTWQIHTQPNCHSDHTEPEQDV